MADQKSEEKATKKGGLNVKVIGVIAAVMLVEAGAVIFAMRMLNPATGTAADIAKLENDPLEQSVELPVADGRYQNMRTGRVWVWDLKVFVRVKTRHAEHVRTVLDRHRNEISEGVNQIVRRAEHSHLIEPEHRTIRRLLFELLDEVLRTDEDGKSYIQAVILPTCQGLPADF